MTLGQKNNTRARPGQTFTHHGDDHGRRPFIIVIVFVAAEKYEIDRCLVAVGLDGYDNRNLRRQARHRCGGIAVSGNHRMLEEMRVMSRFGFALGFGCAFLTLTVTGCSDAWNAGPMKYVESESLTKDVGKTNLFGKAVLQDKVRAALAGLYGDSPQQIKVPAGAGLTAGGLYLGNLVQEGAGADAKIYAIYESRGLSSPVKVAMSEIGDARQQEGGYAIYRKNCLHCHGVSGAGDGPTAPFLYPLPRDYRKGIFKFTSTASGAKPDRSDLRRTIKNGLHGTSMPAFDALLVEPEIEQVIDYVIFLSMRGETELALIEEASISDEKDPNALSDDVVKDVANNIF
jgi:mono/diheme cytochrome c family protein